MRERPRIHKASKPVRVIGKNLKISGLTNNAVIVAGTGGGKTTCYVSPNISAAEEESLVVLDTKNNLYRRHKEELLAKGYDVQKIDFCTIENSSIGWNPLDIVRTYGEHGQAKIDDIKELSSMLCPSDHIGSNTEKFWETSAANLIACCLSLVFHLLPDEEHSLCYVKKLVSLVMDENRWNMLIKEAKNDDPDCLEVEINETLTAGRKAERMTASFAGIAGCGLDLFTFDGCEQLYHRPDRIKFADLGRKRMCLFISIPDFGPSKDAICSLLLYQIIQQLLMEADSQPRSTLKNKVHIIADDIGANFVIPRLPQLMSIIRSRGIGITLLIQSIDQIYAKYSTEANVILGNCNIISFLASSVDNDTAQFFSTKSNLPIEEIINLPLTKSLICLPGIKPFIATKTKAEYFSKPIEFIKEESELQVETEPEEGLKEETTERYIA